MEDLAGLNFSSSSSSQPKSVPPNQSRLPQNTTTNYISPIPSRGLSPNYINISASQSNSGSLPRSTSKPDSFASLSAFSGISSSRQSGQASNASLEQQRLAKEKEMREALKKEKRNLDIHFGDDEFWEKHSRQATPTITTTDTYAHLREELMIGLEMLI